MTKIAIIGAGPSGLLLSLYLTNFSAQFSQRVRVSVFEREGNHNLQVRSNPDRSYTIDITGHGLKAIRSVGADLEKRFDKELIGFKGIHAYTINKTLPYSEKGWTGSRGDICSSLLHELEAKLKTRCEYIDVALNWNSEVSSVDPISGKIGWQSDGVEQIDEFDLIVGADGGGSMLRRCLEEKGLLTTQKRSIPNYSRILHLDNNAAESALESTLLHSFSLNPWAVGGAILDTTGLKDNVEVDQATTPRKFYVQMGFSNDTPYKDSNSAEATINNIRVSGDDRAHKINPNSVTLRHYVSDSELQSFAQRPVYHTGKTVKCSTLATEKCVLLGDAATAFPPVGQGVNAALEGATVLGDILVQEFSRSKDSQNLANTVARYSNQWLPQANACADIANTIVYGSLPSRIKLLLQGAFAELTGVDIAAAQLAKHSKYSYVQALQKSRIRNSLVVAVTLMLLAIIVSIAF